MRQIPIFRTWTWDPDWQVTAESDEQTYFSLCYEFCRYDRKMEEKTYEKKE